MRINEIVIPDQDIFFTTDLIKLTGKKLRTVQLYCKEMGLRKTQGIYILTKKQVLKLLKHIRKS